MPRKTLIAGNWKMNKTVAEALELIDGLKAGAADMGAVEALVCPPFTDLAAVAAAVAGTPIMVGAQSVHWAESGAFTAEISADMLKEIPVTHAIIGHSERRQYFAETDETVNLRLKAALAAGLTPVVCFGETLEQRQADETQTVVETQVKGGLADITADQMKNVILAYEPVWAIGTGMTATPEQAQEVHAFVRGLLNAAFGAVADDVQILYGGSVKASNAAELTGQPDIDGGLVGGASLKAEDFLGIIRNSC
ncbi:MAG: triose-phosphate isomerase [Lentisphaerae bacterium]|jgi:triosephosphate isomerase (TIM)|nr:triose-phosphate isomerase [Lentisphaerota bacterium]MBT4814193.1 triose-phosphate isomerase [Lentisphaerota bacterium]MBT5609604.1 triose-phosphate isomerase [Lentisphaerota bacterium]MBT7060886.1 triose-phosphate isomerase [Lentisphaerota bacterium]MBT7842519.1 triose-phosphate isomerase [Lentisphaerota bacterium]